eukprot:Cvel_30477.t1-p1 / transcript=Cvel_30477.t1 / gene=Cvel_30477 / organism=Chromera_velia_CCMP2878 / gene_product=Putative 60S ribosomal protein L22-1, putative / transcript_product=Putative 60S ribosomal protein L22-1, putative / location=Cvel_scaffold4352:9002-9585(+) / protein_length=84 / sequence_SO=supercontig / SO=protein_coding / is_pseudo=false
MTKVKIGKKTTGPRAKKPVVKYTVDCKAPVDDNILDPAQLEKYFQDRIKVEGKTANLGEKVSISRDKARIHVQAELPFSKRYLK